MNQMNRETKHLLVKSIIDVVDRSPTTSKDLYENGLSEERFKIWVKYACSVIDVFKDSLNPYDYWKIKKDIENILNENKPIQSYEEKTHFINKAIKICQLLLAFAQKFI